MIPADDMYHKESIQEKWYLRNVTIGVLLVMLSTIPFAAILAIPLIVLKGKDLRNYARDQLTEANKKANEMISEAQSKADDLNRIINDKEQFVERIRKEALQDVAEEENKINDRIRNARLKLSELDKDIENRKSQVIELDETTLLQSFALYEPKYDFVNSEQYKNKLDEIRQYQKEMIKNDVAADGDMDWTVNGSASEGRKMVKDTQKLLLRAFNGECEYVIGKVKYNNFESSEKRISSAYTAISKLGRTMQIKISREYYELKIEELRLALEYQQMKQQEKERQRELREQEREEAALRKEIEEARKKILKEQTHYVNALKTTLEQLKAAKEESERQALLDKVNELETHMAEIDKNLKDVDYREANQRAGYVYIISNIGSFGEDIYKIGMTRRLDPMERINELGGASVPFNFDVHAMIFSDDAPKLEAALHRAFETKKVNMINTRREFFRVSLDEIKKVVKANYDNSVDFIETADAEQYRESQKMHELVA